MMARAKNWIGLLAAAAVGTAPHGVAAQVAEPSPLSPTPTIQTPPAPTPAAPPAPAAPAAAPAPTTPAPTPLVVPRLPPGVRIVAPMHGQPLTIGGQPVAVVATGGAP